MKKKIISSEDYVWADADGKIRGQAIEPLAKSVVKAVRQDATLYKILALVDVLRVGKIREFKLIFDIALWWTVIDFLLFILRKESSVIPLKVEETGMYSAGALFLRELNVVLFSFMIGFLLVSVLKKILRNYSLWVNLLLKTLLLVIAAIVMNLFIYVSYKTLIAGQSIPLALQHFVDNTFRPGWLLPKMTEWTILFILTLLALEINDKYSRGVFFAIMMGKYLQPKEEKRILLFVDLKNSTPIAEKLGHKEYFKFIRDFIYCL